MLEDISSRANFNKNFIDLSKEEGNKTRHSKSMISDVKEVVAESGLIVLQRYGNKPRYD